MHDIIWLDKLIVIFFCVGGTQCGFEYCHDEPAAEPAEGLARPLDFSWLGALQYIHIERGTPEYWRVPRVVLVSTQYVLCTARDAVRVPPGYALGNVIFDQYERDESECGLTLATLDKPCPAGVLSVPIADVHLHPEHYQHANDSVALLKLLTPARSRYLLPICLPFNDNILTKNGKFLKWLYHIDYSSVTPRDMMNEERDFYKISVLSKKECHYSKYNLTKHPIICTSGCEFHSGAPSVIHERTGHWTLVTLAVGGSPCRDPLNSPPPRRVPPARHILVYPYIEWITQTITGVVNAPFAKDDPFGFGLFQMPPSEPDKLDKFGPGWLGHWWLSSNACYSRGEDAEPMDNFYSEKFRVPPDGILPKNYYIEIFAPDASTIVCIKVGLPYQLAAPQAWGMGTTAVKLNIPVVNLHTSYRIHVVAWSINDAMNPKPPKDVDIDENNK